MSAPAKAPVRAPNTAAARFARPRGVALLWFGVLAGPAAWAAHLQATYTLVPHACERGTMTAVHAVTAASLVLALAGAAVAWRSWRLTGAAAPGGEGGVVGRSRFMALGGLVLALYFTLLIAGEAIPGFLVPPCH